MADQEDAEIVLTWSDPSTPDNDRPSKTWTILIPSVAVEKSKLLSASAKRWKPDESAANVGISHRQSISFKINTDVKAASVNDYKRALQLLGGYTTFESVLATVQEALAILQASAEMLYEDGINECIRYLEAVPWSKEEEKKVVTVVQSLMQLESTDNMQRVRGLLARTHRISQDKVCDLFSSLLEQVCCYWPKDHKSLDIFGNNVVRVKTSHKGLVETILCKEISPPMLPTDIKNIIVERLLSTMDQSEKEFTGRRSKGPYCSELKRYLEILNWLLQKLIDLMMKRSCGQITRLDPNRKIYGISYVNCSCDKKALSGGCRDVEQALCELWEKFLQLMAKGFLVTSASARANFVKTFLNDQLSSWSFDIDSTYVEKSIAELLQVVSTLPMSTQLKLFSRPIDDCPCLLSRGGTLYWKLHAQWLSTLEERIM